MPLAASQPLHPSPVAAHSEVAPALRDHLRTVSAPASLPPAQPRVCAGSVAPAPLFWEGAHVRMALTSSALLIKEDSRVTGQISKGDPSQPCVKRLSRYLGVCCCSSFVVFHTCVPLSAKKSARDKIWMGNSLHFELHKLDWFFLLLLLGIYDAKIT